MCFSLFVILCGSSLGEPEIQLRARKEGLVTVGIRDMKNWGEILLMASFLGVDIFFLLKRRMVAVIDE